MRSLGTVDHHAAGRHRGSSALQVESFLRKSTRTPQFGKTDLTRQDEVAVSASYFSLAIEKQMVKVLARSTGE